MTLRFTFFYKDLDYFLWLLRKVADSHSVESCVEIGDGILHFFASGTNENDLGEFATALEGEIPLSLYFKLKNVEVCEKPTKSTSISIARQNGFFALSEINAIKNPKNPRFCDIFNTSSSQNSQSDSDKPTSIYIASASAESHNDNQITSKDSLKNALQNLCALLKDKQTITLSTSKGNIALFTQKNTQDFDFILANDISTISLFTRATHNEINALASVEKPLVDLKIKEIFTKEMGIQNALFILPYDIILCCISSILLELEIPLVYAKKIDSKPNDLYYESPKNSNFFEPKDSIFFEPKDSIFFEIVIGQNGYFLEKNFLDSSKIDSDKMENFSHFLDFTFPPLQKTQGDLSQNSDIFITYISTKNPTLLANLGDKIPHIKISFDKNPKNILQKITTLENGDKLIAHFAREFEVRYNAIQSLDSTIELSENITDIFECAAMILGYNRDKNAILKLANAYLRDIGPKVDFKNTTNPPNTYDVAQTIRTIISFTLAGSESEVIAFGILESLVDYLVLICRDVQDKKSIKNVGIVGDLFADKIFFDKITKKFPTSLNLMLPKYVDFR